MEFRIEWNADLTAHAVTFPVKIWDVELSWLETTQSDGQPRGGLYQVTEVPIASSLCFLFNLYLVIWSYGFAYFIS